MKLSELNESFDYIFQHINVSDQKENISKLSNKDRLILLSVCLIHHDVNDLTVVKNFLHYKNEIDIIKENIEDYQDNANIVVPNIFTVAEIRKKRINNILDGE